jgi:NifU-like protein involved in Fe-S cluster formation
MFCVFSEIAKHLSLPPVKLHCSMLAEDAIKAAVKDYEAKKAKLGDGPAEKAAEA